MSVKFSVITPVYNAAAYIDQTLRNLAVHDCALYEIIFIDDGSADGSADILACYCSAHTNARLIKSPHRGVSAARNLGISSARGEYILFLDADDSFSEDIFSVLGAHIAQTHPDILVFGAKVINHSADYVLKDISPRNVIYEGFHPDILFKEEGARPYVWNCAYRTQFLRQNNITFDEEISLGEDNLFQFTAYPLAKVTEFISDKLYCYNYLKYNSAMSGILNDDFARSLAHIKVVDKVIAAISRIDWDNSAKKEFFLWIYDFLYRNMLPLRNRAFRHAADGLKSVFKKHGIRISKIPVSIKKKLCFYSLCSPWVHTLRKFLHMM